VQLKLNTKSIDLLRSRRVEQSSRSRDLCSGDQSHSHILRSCVRSH
jgi:hypothetical protein